MLYAYEVYEVILDLCRKDKRGRSLAPEEYNRTARLVNEMVFSKYFAKFESTPENSETMSAFKVLNESIPIVAGIGALPARFYHLVGMPRYTDLGGVSRYLDLVTSMEHAKRQRDYLTQASLTYPTCRFGTVNAASDMTLYIEPTAGVTPIYIDYIRTPDVPYLDYYVNDTTLVYTWMASGVNVNVPSGSTAMDGTVGAAVVASDTVNWEFDDEDMPMIINLFLKFLGIQLPSPELFEGGTLLETKEEEQ